MKGLGSLLVIASFIVGALDIIEIVTLAGWIWGAITIAFIVGIIMLIAG